MVNEGIVLGHKVSKVGFEVDQAKIEANEKLPPPSNIKGILNFLSHIGFYRRFNKDFSIITKSLCQLLLHNVPYVFSKECDKASILLKQALISASIVKSLD